MPRAPHSQAYIPSSIICLGLTYYLCLFWDILLSGPLYCCGQCSMRIIHIMHASREAFGRHIVHTMSILHNICASQKSGGCGSSALCDNPVRAC